MAQREQNKLLIDGSRFHDLEVESATSNRPSGWSFLTHVVPQHPWIAGLAAIVGVIASGGGQSPWVQIAAIFGVTAITVNSAWTWRSNDRTKATSESDDVRQNSD